MTAVTVWCDDAGHPARRERVFVAEFVREGVVWMPRATGTRPPRSVQWWVAANGIEVAAGEDRDRVLLHHTMWCRYCGQRRPLTVRVGKLDATLDHVAAAGRVAVTLAELRAILNVSGR